MKKLLTTTMFAVVSLLLLMFPINCINATEAPLYAKNIYVPSNIAVDYNANANKDQLTGDIEESENETTLEMAGATEIEEETLQVEDVTVDDPDITFSYEYINSDVMPYALVTPSSAETNEKTPLIIFLHGTGDRGINAEKFGSRYIANLMQNWELDGFDAYVMMPHLAGKAYNSTWNAGTTAKRLFTIIDQVVEEYNIDTDRIVISGHSMGGYGCLYMAAYNTEYFSAVVPISAYESSANLNKLTDMPIRCYVGSPSHGEDWSTFRFTTNTLKNRFGEDAIFQRDVSHKEIPIVAFTEDLDENNKSDLVEWMLLQAKPEKEEQES